ncbi:MAG: RHS repeat-associated core domain-containing protein, partial [Myxococcota bacterium]
MSYEYDAAGRLLSVTLADGSTQTIRYDGFGRIDSVERPGVGSVFYTYHPTSGQLETVAYVDSAGAAERMVSIERDAIGRVTAEIHTLAATGETLRFDHGYDGEQGGGQPVVSGQLGRRTVVSGTGFVRSEIYNPDDTLASARLELDGWLRFDSALTYYADGKVKTHAHIVTRLADGAVIDDVTWTYRYDAYGRMSRSELGGVVFATYSYDSEGRLDQVTLPGGEVLALTYDSTTHRSNGYSQGTGTGYSSASWRLSARGLVERETLIIGADTVVRDYQYDERGFLTEASDGQQTSSYTYTTSGLPYSISDMEGARVAYRGTASTLTVAGINYTWDSSGRVTGRGDLALYYGPDGQLARATRAGHEWRYIHDERGQRLLKLADGLHVAAFVEGTYATDSRVIRPVMIAGRLIGMLDNGAFELLATDPRGTRLADVDGTARLPTPYGVRSEQPDLSEALDFIEKAYDPDLGVVRLGVRDYDPLLSQFWTPDPLFLASIDKCAESPVQCNLYGYAAGNPISLIDPSGMESDRTKLHSNSSRAVKPYNTQISDLPNVTDVWYADRKDWHVDPNNSDFMRVGIVTLKGGKQRYIVQPISGSGENLGRYDPDDWGIIPVSQETMAAVEGAQILASVLAPVAGLARGMVNRVVKSFLPRLKGICGGGRCPCFVAGTAIDTDT